MTVCDASVTDALATRTVHHEMDSVFHSHNVYKSVWSPVMGEKLVLEKEPACQSTQ